MSSSSSLRIERLCICTGAATIVLFMIGVFSAHMFPPPAPSAGAEEIGRLFDSHQTGILIGTLFIGCGGCLYFAFTVALTNQLRRIEGPANSLLAWVNLGGGLLASLDFCLISWVWAVLAFRSGHSPDTVQVLNDLIWLMITVTVWPLNLLQMLPIAILAFSDQSKDPVFSRTIGYFNVYVAILFMTGTLALFFKHGPFGWNGLLSFYFELGLFVTWLVVMTVAMLRAANAHAAEVQAAEHHQAAVVLAAA